MSNTEDLKQQVVETLRSRIQGDFLNSHDNGDVMVKENQEFCEKEAPLERFASANGLDVDRAWKGFKRYWKARCECLGDQALSPVRKILDLNASSAPETMILPFDKLSRSVLYVGLSDCHNDQARKDLFCYTHLVSENPESQADGFVVIHDLDKDSADCAVEVSHFLSTATMGKVKNYFIVSTVAEPQVLEPKITKITRALSALIPPVKPVIIVAASTEDLQGQLENEGLDAENIPEDVGGTFSHAQMKQWMKEHAVDSCKPISDWSGLVSMVKTTVSNYFGLSNVPQADMSQAKSKAYNTGSSTSTIDFEKLKSNPTAALKRIEEAMEFVSEQDRLAYHEAKRRAPHLIETESNPVRYLQAENYNIWAAARRIGFYWRSRIEYFADRAFLPMALNDNVESALSDIDKKIFKSGIMTIAPSDEKGRTVLLYNFARLNKTSFELNEHQDARARSYFMALQLASEIDSCLEKGLIIVADMTFRKHKSRMDPNIVHRSLQLLRLGAFPISFERGHFIVRPGKIAQSWLDILYPFVRRWSHLLLGKALLHMSNDRNEVLSILERHGLKKQGLYHSLGGSWSYKKDFKLWLDYREYQESIRFDLPHDTKESSGNGLSIEEFQKIQKRKVDVVYARRKRERYRIELDVLENRAREYRAKNSQLRSRNTYYEDLLRQAEDILAQTYAASSLSLWPPQPEGPRGLGFQLGLQYHRQNSAPPPFAPSSLATMRSSSTYGGLPGRDLRAMEEERSSSKKPRHARK